MLALKFATSFGNKELVTETAEALRRTIAKARSTVREMRNSSGAGGRKTIRHQFKSLVCPPPHPRLFS